MRTFILFFFCFSLSFCFSQIEFENQDSIVTCEDTLVVTLLFDSLPAFSYFNPFTITNHQSRITALQTNPMPNELYFYLILIFSLLVTLVYLNSKEMVKNSLKSLTSVQNTIQFSRTEKQSNGIYFGLYFAAFVFGISILAHYIFSAFYGLEYGFLRIIGFSIVILMLDYLASYLFLLFTTNDRSIEMVQTVALTYPVLLSFVLWPALFFVVLSALPVGKIFLTILLFMLGLVFILKEIRTLQVLRIEKIDIFSFHFFAYLCTFKFLPLFVLAKVFF